jgi:hypothetical protein
LLNERRAFQAQPRAIRDHARRMMMADDLDPLPSFGRAMAMMKIEALRFPGLLHFDLAAQLPIVIPRDHDRLAVRRQILQKLRGFRRGRLVVHQVAEDD